MLLTFSWKKKNETNNIFVGKGKEEKEEKKIEKDENSQESDKSEKFEEENNFYKIVADEKFIMLKKDGKIVDSFSKEGLFNYLHLNESLDKKAIEEYCCKKEKGILSLAEDSEMIKNIEGLLSLNKILYDYEKEKESSIGIEKLHELIILLLNHTLEVIGKEIINANDENKKRYRDYSSAVIFRLLEYAKKRSTLIEKHIEELSSLKHILQTEQKLPSIENLPPNKLFFENPSSNELPKVQENKTMKIPDLEIPTQKNLTEGGKKENYKLNEMASMHSNIKTFLE